MAQSCQIKPAFLTANISVWLGNGEPKTAGTLCKKVHPRFFLICTTY